MNTLPKTIDPIRLSNEGSILVGTLQLSEMSRLADMLLEPTGEAGVELHFSKDEQGLSVIKGQIVAQVVLQCQRCLGAFKYDIKTSFVLSPVRSDKEAKQLPWSYDALPISEEPIKLQTIIEDELILNLPIVAMHTPELCKIKLPQSEATKVGKSADFKANNPFQKLKALKDKNH